MRKITYSEPLDYFPKDIRKKYKLGEYSERVVAAKKEKKMADKRKKKTK